MEKKQLIELRKRLMALGTIGALGLTGVTGCGKVKRENVPTVASETTVSLTTETTAPAAEEKKVEVTKDMATEEYMAHAKSVAKAMYDANKAYFDDEQYTVEDLENVYYVINGKYYNSNREIIMDKPQLDRSFDIIRSLAADDRETEMLQKYSDLEHKRISEKEYFDEVKASKFYDHKVSLSNFVDKRDNNKDLRDFLDAYAIASSKIQANIIAGVSSKENLEEIISIVKSASQGDLTKYNGIKNYMQQSTTEDGYGFLIAAISRSLGDKYATTLNGCFGKINGENTRFALSYKEQELVNAYYLGDLEGNEEAILKARKYIAEKWQTYWFDIECNRQDAVNTKMGYEPVARNTKTYTK